MGAASARGEVAIVTGATGGIGTHVVDALLARGVAVLVAGRRRERVDATVDRLGGDGREVSGFAGDLAADGVAEGCVATARERYGHVTRLANVAAYEGVLAEVEHYPVDDFDRVLAVNVRSAFLVLRAVVPALRAAGRGRIVNVGSQAGLRGVPGCAAYAASKHALIGLSGSLALELAQDGIPVNVVCPGPTNTEMIARVEQRVADGGGRAADIREHIPTRRYGRPEEVAGTIAWLLTEAPTQLTGAVVPVDGALTTG